METQAIIRISDNATCVLIVIISLTFIYECIKLLNNGNKQ